MIERTSPELMAVARGDQPADLVFRDARFVNVLTREIETASISVFRGRIASIGAALDAAQIIDVGTSLLVPGFIDAHMHVESTMLLPGEFVRLAAPHGTTGVVLDPHEIANVLGLSGIRFLMEQSRDLPMSIFFGASSCVPSSPLETAGASLDASDLAPLFEDERVIALAEMMNFPGVFLGDAQVHEKIRLGLERAIVDGHCPGLTGPSLNAYIASGISSDHESTTADEALEKLRRGLQVYLREGSAARNLEALVPAVTEKNAHRCCFCTDDRHPGDLESEGHIDHVVRRAISFGLDPVLAIAMATLHPAQHYGLRDHGALAPGRRADILLIDDLESIGVRQVYCEGELIAEDGRCLAPISAPCLDGQDAARATVQLPQGLSEASLRINAANTPSLIRVIGSDPHQLVTTEHRLPPSVVDQAYVADPSRDILKLAVIARHGTSDGIGLGFVTGFGFSSGALASTVGHDAHNLSVVGASDRDMVVAARALERAAGGQCVVQNGEVLALLPLPIAGLLSASAAPTVIAQQRELLSAAASIGCPIADPFMPLSFLPLPVIPKLKLTDRGLVDVDRFEVVPLDVIE